MSLEAYRRVWAHSKTNGSWRVVMLAIAEHANRSGEAWPGFATLAAACGVSVRTVQRIVKDLEQMGEIRIQRGDGRGKMSVIKLTPENGAQGGLFEQDKGGHDTSPFKRDKRVTNTSPFIEAEKGDKRVTSEDERVTNSDSVLYIEPIEPVKSGALASKKTASKAKPKTRFVKPHLETDVIPYFIEQKSTSLEAHKWFDHFESNGWKVSGRAAMKDWQASARNWIRNIGAFQIPRPAVTESFQPKPTYRPSPTTETPEQRAERFRRLDEQDAANAKRGLTTFASSIQDRITKPE